jgi:cysteine-rich repeat protein
MGHPSRLSLTLLVLASAMVLAWAPAGAARAAPAGNNGITPAELGVMGDGVVNGVTEACDDGNTASGDGCSSSGQVEPGKACTGEPSVCGNVVYVGGSGSGDRYACTGGTDDAALNDALGYVHTHAGYVGVRIRSGVRCTIVANSLLLYNNTALEGEAGAGLTMASHAGWPQYKPIVGAAESPPKNLTVAGLDIDGNAQNQGLPGTDTSHYQGLIVNNITGLIVHDVSVHNNHGDAFRVDPGHRLHFWRNSCQNINHDCYYILDGSDNVRVHDDPVLSTGTNSGVRLVQVTNAKVYRETIHGIAHSCVQIQGSGSVEVRDILCYDAVNGIGAGAYGTHPADQLTLWAHHNIIYQSRSSTTGRTSGIACNGFYCTIEQNTISGIATGPAIGTMDTVNSGTTVGSGYTIQARDNILVNSLRGVDNVNASRNTFPSLNNNCFWNNSSDFGNVGSGTNNVIADPLFVNLAGNDYHLKSTGGHYSNGSWVVDAVTSPCIDKGDPAAPFDLEPAPNGGRANIGRYGDTIQASKTPGAPSPAPTPAPAYRTPV